MNPSTRPPFRGLLIGAALLAGSAMASAQTYSEWGSVTRLGTAWSGDAVAVYHSAPLVNPSGCAITNGGYASSPSDPGRKLMHTILLAAFLNRKEVAILVQGCAYDKPRVIAVDVR
jgi:hypothetical protein